MVFGTLSDSEHAFYTALIMRVDERCVPQAQLGFFALAAHHVRGLCLKTLDLSGPGALETLLGTRVCLHLRHYEYL